MSKTCQLFGTKPGFGKSVSHSHRRTNRRFNPNVQWKRFWLPSDKRGIELVVAELRGRGVKV
ncbi:MAG TPA: 50S ribosomal protein L28 [Ilumatobacter sp.]|nr:50S ribosomal protein L28 [Ilumatobacter sp.]